MIRPHFFELSGFTDESGFHHAGRVRVILVQLLDAIEGGGSQTEDRSGETRSAPARLYRELTSSSNRYGPIDIGAGRVSCIIECTRVLKVSNGTQAGFELHLLPIDKVGGRVALADRQADSCASPWSEFQYELIAAIVEGRGFDHTSAHQDGFPRTGIDLRWPAGCVQRL